MHRFPERTRRLVLAGFTACLAGACDDSKSRTDLPDWSDGYETGGPIAGGTTGGFDVDGGQVLTQDGGTPVTPDTMTIAIPEAVTWPMRIRNHDDLSLPCEIPRDDPATELVYDEPKDVNCIIDSDELDLWVLGLQFDVVIPEGMCEYLRRDPYVFENFEIGVGPTIVSYTKEEDGTCSDEVHSENCEPVCDYDYKRLNPDLPNCCYGEYDLVITSAKTMKPTMARKSWGGGKRGECYYGAGYLDSFGKDTEGLPVSEIIYLNRQPYVSHEVFEGVSEKFGSNIALSNYFEPDDHEGGAPGGMLGVFASPTYRYVCLDHAEETIARIEIVVREWNEEAQFDVDGDPDTEGVETWPDMFPINDLFDWKDFAHADDELPHQPHL